MQPSPARAITWLSKIGCASVLKRAAAEVNVELGLLEPELAVLITQASDEVRQGRLDAEFPLKVFQTGSGTHTNMNVNEVIAGRANELAGHGRGGRVPVHPNDHVNRSQSSNDAFPTAMSIAAVEALEARVIPAIRGLVATLNERASAFGDVVKVGRTHLMDAVPMTVGQEISGWTAALQQGLGVLEGAHSGLLPIAAGGTAVGTGLGSHPEFARRVAQRIALLTGQPFLSAPNKFACLAGHDALVFAHAALKQLATVCFKLANDVRLLASGPRTALGELRLPALEPGSSMMPGKVNPTQAEALSMVCLEVLGNDVTLSMAAAHGQLQLNVNKPLIIHTFLRSARLLGDAVASFDARCVRGWELERETIARHLTNSLMLATALVPALGYDLAARVASHAHARGLSLRQAAVEVAGLSEEAFDGLVRPDAMAHALE
jgi:fumarate hydratase class II